MSRRVPSGGYSFYRTPSWHVEEPNAPDTLAALRSLAIVGLPFPEPDSTADWLTSLQNVDGGFATVRIGWAVLHSLEELGRALPASATEWVRRIRHRPDLDGPRRDWGGSIQTLNLIVDCCHLVGVDPPVDVIAALLDRAHVADGGWARPGADLSTTAFALLLGLEVDDSDARDDAARVLRGCEDPELGLRDTPTTIATSVASLRGGATIASLLSLNLRFRDQIDRSLALAQRADGGVGARHRAIATLRSTWDALEADQLLHSDRAVGGGAGPPTKGRRSDEEFVRSRAPD